MGIPQQWHMGTDHNSSVGHCMAVKRRSRDDHELQRAAPDKIHWGNRGSYLPTPLTHHTPPGPHPFGFARSA